MTDIAFSALPLAAPLHRSLKENAYTMASPIQAQAIPLVLEGRDLLGCAQTGTGKTAAFALPILNHFASNPRRPAPRGVRALVLVPTRELAVQVNASFQTYGKYLPLKTGLVYGGVGAGPQIRTLSRGVDVLIATPGRLLDLWQQKAFSLDQVEFLVLDEADRMLDMGFIHDVRRIEAALPRKRQSLFFSATLSKPIIDLASSILVDPAQVSVAPSGTTVEKVDHQVCFLQRNDKLDLLTDSIRNQKVERQLTLVFSRTKHGADRLTKSLLQRGIRAAAIHGNKTQANRQRALEQFRSGRSPVLVATDVAARGLDVRNITLVVNYDLPVEAENYVHRIGRTARAGAEGRALSFCTSEELELFNEIERLIQNQIPTFEEHEYHDSRLAETSRTKRGSRGGAPGKGGRKRPTANRRGRGRGRVGGGARFQKRQAA